MIDFKVNVCIREDFSTWLLDVKEIVDNRVVYLRGKRCHTLICCLMLEPGCWLNPQLTVLVIKRRHKGTIIKSQAVFLDKSHSCCEEGPQSLLVPYRHVT